MDIPRELRNELNALSKEVFGVSSKWQTFLKKGTSQLVTKKSTETIPGKDGAEDTIREIDVPVLTPYGAKQFVQKYHSVDEMRALLLSYKKQMEDFREQIKKQQEEQAAKQAEEKALKEVQELAHGSAL